MVRKVPRFGFVDYSTVGYQVDEVKNACNYGKQCAKYAHCLYDRPIEFKL